VADDKQQHMVDDPDTDLLVFADRPAEAPVVHIGGLLSIDLSYSHVGGDDVVLRVRIGTPGLGRGAFAARVLPDVFPVAVVELPSKEPGGAAVVTKAILRDR
jgi:hypothetical protein